MSSELLQYIVEELKSQHRDIRAEFVELRNQFHELRLEVAARSPAPWKFWTQAAATIGALFAAIAAYLK